MCRITTVMHKIYLYMNIQHTDLINNFTSEESRIWVVVRTTVFVWSPSDAAGARSANCRSRRYPGDVALVCLLGLGGTGLLGQKNGLDVGQYTTLGDGDTG